MVRKCLIGLLSFVSAPGLAAWQLNMKPGVTPVSQAIYDLHMIGLWVCIGIGIFVFGVLFYALIHHRRTCHEEPAQFHENTKIEIIWAIIPFLILVALAIPATKTLITMEDSSDADVTIKIVGYQWRWEYQYLDEGIKFFSNLSTPFEQIQGRATKNPNYLLEVDKPLILPIHRKIRFLVTANDVIHSWWVPELGIKRDAIPGFIHEAWARIEKPGIYRGQCAELCGVFHAYMPIVVNAVTEEEYAKWVSANVKPRVQPEPVVITPEVKPDAQPEAQPEVKPEIKPEVKPEAKLTPTWTMAHAMQLGQQKYATFCIACHKEDGTGMPPVFPALKGSSITVGRPIARHITNVLFGVPGTAMQAFASQINDEEIAAIITYERNAWKNNTGDLVTPEDVAELRASRH